MQSPFNNSRLSRRDREVIDHVARYRLSTVAALRATVLGGLTRPAAGKMLKRLCEAGYLCSYPLFHPTRYFVLGSDGAKALGLSVDRSLPLGPQSLPIEFAALVYATLGKRQRKRAERLEILALCPWLPAKLISAPHCLDDVDGALELLRIDLGGPPDHVARKCVRDIAERQRLPEFTPFVRSGKFRLVVVTSTKAKAAVLRQAIDRHD